jgi:hypothetical protein
MNSIIKSLVRSILVNPFSHEWSVQGFGMLRTYFPQSNMRMHIWDNRLTYPNVSTIHSHPWDFESYIVAGGIRNRKYEMSTLREGGEIYLRQKILCGEGAQIVEDAYPVSLFRKSQMMYTSESTYAQFADEIHETEPLNGTVTLVERLVRPGRSADHAYVYYNTAEGWVPATPRPATPDEVLGVISRSYDRWFR